ncbi:MAG TPA: hypothetical protein VN611_07255 [Patescibacteria group bacterium]|nr:hypothetical protein [Patescibacteria group bacterium]
MQRFTQCKKSLLIILIAGMVSFSAVPAAVQAIGIGDLLKVGGVGFVVDRLAGPLNNFINGLMVKSNAGTSFATKVVPIVSAGSQGHVGAAQVTGSQELVDRTQAVLQLEGDFSGLRVKGLIPIDSKNPLSFSRVQGVGVSAIIDINL